jgi:hypothetical protein
MWLRQVESQFEDQRIRIIQCFVRPVNVDPVDKFESFRLKFIVAVRVRRKGVIAVIRDGLISSK